MLPLVRTRQRPETPQRKGKWRDPGYALRQNNKHVWSDDECVEKGPGVQDEHKQEATRLTGNGNGRGRIREAGCMVVMW